MAEFVIPITLVLCAVVLIVLLGANETQLRKEEDEPVVLSEFEHHQERVREARKRAEWRKRQNTIERERERL